MSVDPWGWEDCTDNVSESQLRAAFTLYENDSLEDCRIFCNTIYQVMRRPAGGDEIPVVWLSIKRHDQEPIHDWRHLQRIKNDLVGPECEAVEIYPPESRLVDTSNQFHLWVFSDGEFRLPFGFGQRFVMDAVEAAKIGAKQRPFENPPADLASVEGIVDSIKPGPGRE